MLALEPYRWYVATTKPNRERTVASLVAERGYKCLLPCYQSRQSTEKGVQHVERPLFPGYVFWQTNPFVKALIVTTPGIRTIVSFGGKALPVADDEIAAVQKISESQLLREPWRFVKSGTRVKIISGPLAGTIGRLTSDHGNRMLLIMISLLGRAVAVRLSPDTLLSIIEADDLAGKILSFA
jgi:transcription antitermination factor NusG